MNCNMAPNDYVAMFAHNLFGQLRYPIGPDRYPVFFSIQEPNATVQES